MENRWIVKATMQVLASLPVDGTPYALCAKKEIWNHPPLSHFMGFCRLDRKIAENSALLHRHNSGR
jgi:hypothetical protein